MSILTARQRPPQDTSNDPDRPAVPAEPDLLLKHREAEAPDAGRLRRREAPETRVARQTEAPDAGDGRAALLEHEFTHGRSQS